MKRRPFPAGLLGVLLAFGGLDHQPLRRTASHGTESQCGCRREREPQGGTRALHANGARSCRCGERGIRSRSPEGDAGGLRALHCAPRRRPAGRAGPRGLAAPGCADLGYHAGMAFRQTASASARLAAWSLGTMVVPAICPGAFHDALSACLGSPVTLHRARPDPRPLRADLRAATRGPGAPTWSRSTR